MDGGRCKYAKAEGTITVEMQFMADISLPCEACNSKRFKSRNFRNSIQGKSISDVLEMTIDDAVDFFTQDKDNRICKKNH